MEGPEPLSELLRHVLRDLQRMEASALLHTRARLRPSQLPLLGELLETSPLTATELCARCDVDPSTMTGLIQTLVRRGLMTREKVVSDQRRHAIGLTPRGRAAAKVAIKTRLKAEKRLLSRLPRTDAQRLAPLLRALADAARALAESDEA